MTDEYLAPEVLFVENDDCFHVGKPNVRKVSGTSIGALLGKSPYDSPFTCSAKLHRLWGKDIDDKPAIKVGKALEERIIDYVAYKHPDVGQYFKAEDLFAERKGKHDDWEPDFEDPDFTGHVDGIVTSPEGKDYILEVKTVHKETLKTWENGDIPEHYKWQAYLYNHFITHQDKAYFAVGIVDNETYANPYGWVPNKDNCLLIPVTIDQEAVAEGIEKVREIRAHLIATGDTLPFDLNDSRDAMIWQHLHDISADVPHLYDLISECEQIHAQVEEHDAEIKEMRDREAMLRERIKDVMASRNLYKASNYTLTASERKTFDFAKAKADGLDVDQYTKTTSYKTLRRTD